MNFKEKNLSWLLFSLVLIVVFSSIIFYQKNHKVNNNTEDVFVGSDNGIKKPKIDNTKKELTEKEKAEYDNKILINAMLTGEGCDDILYNADLKQKCVDNKNYMIALDKMDKKMCDQLVSEKLRNDCLDKIYNYLAFQNLDSSLCEKISNEDYKQICLDKIQFTFAKTLPSLDSCSSIKNKDIKNDCLDYYYYDNSIKTLSQNSCDNIKDEVTKEKCKIKVVKATQVAQITKKQVAIQQKYKSNEEKLNNCSFLSGDSAIKCQDSINYKLALSQKDISYCDKILDSVLKDECTKSQSAKINNFYLRQAISRKNPQLCSNILDEGLKTECLKYAQ